MKFLSVIFLAIGVFFCAKSEVINDVDVTVKVTLVTKPDLNRDQGVSYGILYSPDSELSVVNIGGWSFEESTFTDVMDALDAMETIYASLMSYMGEDIIDGDGFSISLTDKAICIVQVLGLNQSRLASAISKKYLLLKKAGENAEDEDDNDSVTDKKNELDALVEKANTTINKYVDRGLRNAQTKINSTLNKATKKVTEMTNELIENGKKILEYTDPKYQEQLKEQGDKLRKVQEDMTKIAGLAKTAKDMAEHAIENNMRPIMAFGAVVPPEVFTYSNQVEKLSTYIGYSGNDKKGQIQLPEIPDGFSFNESGDSESGGDNSFPIDGGEGDGKQEFKTLLDYLYAAGFMPFLPPQLEGSVKLSGQQSSFGRFFYFEKKEDSGESEDGGDGMVLHSMNVPMPEEWVVAKPWTYNPKNNEWENAYVQIGYETVKCDGLQAIEGENYVRVNVSTKSVSIDSTSQSDTPNVYCFAIGTISGGKQTSGAYYTPIIFIYH